MKLREALSDCCIPISVALTLNASGDGVQKINNTLNWKNYYAGLAGRQIHENLCYPGLHETIWLQESKLFRV